MSAERYSIIWPRPMSQPPLSLSPPVFSYMGRHWRILPLTDGQFVAEPLGRDCPPDRVLVRLSRCSQDIRRLIQSALCVQSPKWANEAMLAAPASQNDLPPIRLCPHHVWLPWRDLSKLESVFDALPYKQRPKIIHAILDVRICTASAHAEGLAASWLLPP